jgi:26S proteasome non-ATPase regulatory subunit 10
LHRVSCHTAPPHDTFVSLCSHRAAAKGYSAFVRMLIQDGKAKVNLRDSVANTALHLACEESHGDTAVLLIENGADPDILNKDGQVPLDLCATKQLRTFIERAMDA